MASFQLSPGVDIQEVDLTSVIPAVATTPGGYCGDFRWGPCNQVVTISSENQLKEVFGEPTTTKYLGFMTAASFLTYGGALRTVRALSSTANNASTDGSTLVIENGNDYGLNHSGGAGTVRWAAKHPGALGNALTVSVADASNFDTDSVASITVTDGGSGFETAETVTITVAAPTGTPAVTATASTTISTVFSDTPATLTIVGTTATATFASNHGLSDGDIVTVAGATPAEYNGKYQISNASGTSFDYTPDSTPGGDGSVMPTVEKKTIGLISVTLPGSGYTSAPNVTITDSAGGINATATAALSDAWAYAGEFDSAPGTSTYAASLNASYDEMHVVVVDRTGEITGTAGQVLERFPFLSKAPGAKDDTGATSYYRSIINRDSKWIWWMSHEDSTWGTTAVGGTTYGSDFTETWNLSGGADGIIADGDLQDGYELFANDLEVDVALIIAGGHSANVQKWVQDNVALARKDVISFHSPQSASVLGSSPVTDVIADRNALTSTSYSVFDSGWKYMYDRYNEVYRLIPCAGDIAGLCVATDLDSEAWFSPAGYNRGQIRNAARLAWNPNKQARDDLYSAGVNPTVGFAGEGIVLFGDKTMQAKPGAFDRINVRRLFIVLEKAIATAAKFQLFEINDVFTRNQFVSTVEPFLRDVQGRRGIFDFKVVCNEGNNTEEVIDQNRFVADIFVKPYRSINFITLTFVATRTGVSFDEVGA